VLQFSQLLVQFPRISTVLCGHSHFAAEAHIDHIRAVNIGSGYRAKQRLLIESNAGRFGIVRIG